MAVVKFACRICRKPCSYEYVPLGRLPYAVSIKVCGDCATDVQRLGSGADFGVVLKLAERIAALEERLDKLAGGIAP